MQPPRILHLHLCFVAVVLSFYGADAFLSVSVRTTSRDHNSINNKQSVVLMVAADFGQSPNSAGSNAAFSEQVNDDSSTKRPKLDMPWGEIQEWALRDKLAKYTITVPICVKEEDGASETLQSYVLWRALTEDVVELAGYPLSFLVDRYSDILANRNHQGRVASLEILPYLDDYVFEANGGLSGRIYGIRGVAEGTRIQTTPVMDVERSLPKGYILTTDDQIVYELGKPAAAQERTDMDGQKMVARAAASLQSAAAADASDNAQGGVGQLLDPDLVNLGGLTAVTVVGAMAMQSLAHHLTVNVFWV